MIDEKHPSLTIQQQCDLLGLSRSSYYYRPSKVDDLTLTLLRLLDEAYTKYPFYGTRKMMHYLRQQGYSVNRKRIQRLYKLLGIATIYCKPNTSKSSKEHNKYPYLLGDIQITAPNQVYCTDLTYIRMRKGFMYLLAIMDWYSRYVLGWALSPTLESDFCVDLLKTVLRNQQCQIFNSDQGSQFTSTLFTQTLKDNNIKISMDGRGRYLDNIFIERLWRSVKYECVYLHDFACVIDLEKSLTDYLHFYNHERFHQALDYKTPSEIYHKKNTMKNVTLQHQQKLILT